MIENSVDIYKERYATWRHLDQLRYKLVQLNAAFFSALIVLGRSVLISANLHEWLLGLGLISLFNFLILMKINSAIQANGKILRKHGALIGDTDIPSVSGKNLSVFFAIQVFSLVAAIGFFAYSIKVGVSS
jgi:hypothetical protein